MFSCSYIISPIEVEIKISNIPKRIEKVSNAVRSFNGVFANWKSRGYKGGTPPELLEVIVELNETTEDYIEKNGGKYD